MFDFFINGKKKAEQARLQAEKEAAERAEKLNAEERVELNAIMNRNAVNSYLLKEQKRKEEDRQAIFNKLFPRTADNLSCNLPANASPLLKRAVAMDAGFKEFLRPTRENMDNEILDRINDYFIGWQSCAVLKQQWLIDRACTIPAEDAVSPGWKLAYTDWEEADIDDSGEIEDDEQSEKEIRLKKINQSCRDFNIADVCKRAEVAKKTFGYCLVVPQIDGVDMSKPFNPDAVKGKKYKGLSVIEPMWVLPEFDSDGMNPESATFYVPCWYKIAGSKKKIHRSWIVKLINSPVPDILKPVYFYGGVPLTQQIYKRVYCAETVANEAPMLAMTKRLLAIEGDLYQAAAQPEEFQKQMEAFAQCRDNFGIAITQRDSNLHQIDTTLTDFDQLIMTQFQLVASIAQMPVTKLLKVQIKGFDSSGAYERGDYIQSLIAIQQEDYDPIISLHNRLFCITEFGDDIKIKVNFNEVDTPTAKENAEIGFIHAQRDVTYVNSGVLSQDEVRTRLRNDEQSGYTTIAKEYESPMLEFEDTQNNHKGFNGIIKGNSGVTHGGSGLNLSTDRITAQAE